MTRIEILHMIHKCPVICYHRVIRRERFSSQVHECPVHLLPASPHSAPSEYPAGTAQVGGCAGPVMDVLSPCILPGEPHSMTHPAANTDFLVVGCFLAWCPSIQNQVCLGWRNGKWGRACRSAALLIQGTQRFLAGQSLSCSFSLPWESDTTAVWRGMFGCLVGTSSPSKVGCPAGAHTWNHSGHPP